MIRKCCICSRPADGYLVRRTDRALLPFCELDASVAHKLAPQDVAPDVFVKFDVTEAAKRKAVTA